MPEADAKPFDKTLDARVLAAVSARKVRVLEELMLDGADPDACDATGITALQRAAGLGYIEVAGLLLKHGANIDKPNNFGVTPLITAVMKSRDKMVDMLLERGANPDLQDTTMGNTALHHAASDAATGIIEALLEAKANPLIRDFSGGSALETAYCIFPTCLKTISLLRDAEDAKNAQILASMKGKHETQTQLKKIKPIRFKP